MKLCFSTLGCPDWDVWEIAEKAKEYGYQGIELRIKEDKHFPVTSTKEERKKVLAHYKKNGVKIAVIGGYTFWASLDDHILEENKKLMMEYIDLAADLEAEYIRTFIGDFDKAVSIDKIAAKAGQYLQICAEEAEKKNVKILIETHDSFDTGKKVKKVLDNIESNAVGVIWDIHHPVNGGESIEDTYKAIGSKIEHLHLKDAKRLEDGSEVMCLMGEGDLPVKKIVQIMEDSGFSGYYSLEWEKFWIRSLQGPEIAFPQYVDYMKE